MSHDAHIIGRTDADHFTTAFAALRTQIDQPIRGADDIEVVLDHEQRVTCIDQPIERTQQLFDVVEVQPGGGLIENE